MGDIISLIASESEKRKRYAPCQFRNLQRLALRDVYSQQASWTRDRDKVARRRKRWALKKEIFDSRVEEFALSRPMFDPGAGTSWECTEILGKGSFGVVGLWQQFDYRGNPEDSVAIKEIDDNAYLEMARCKDYDVPMEAKAMNELRNVWSVPQLRRLIYFESSKPRWRMYQEYCSCGDLRNLIKVYQQFNKIYPDDEQRIPEAYIWYVFFAFAKALAVMEQPDFHDIRDKYRPAGPRFVLHLDLKDSNVLLADPFKHKILSSYPVVKVCDWGLAQLTSTKDPRNSTKYKTYGTSVWEPPEQKYGNALCKTWRRNPHGHCSGYDAPYTMAQPIWQMAAVVLGLVFLDKDNLLIDEQLKRVQKDEEGSRDVDYVLFSWGKSMEEIYSRELLSLLTECLNVDPKRRPSVTALLQRTKDGLRRVAQKIEQRGGKIPPVFYGTSGFDKMVEYARPRQREEFHEKPKVKKRHWW